MVSASAAPFLKSGQSTQLQTDSVFQIMINGVEQPEIYPVIEAAVKLDVQNYGGQKIVKARFGNPWPDLEGVYKWSDWSVPFDYAFPIKSTDPSEMHLSSE